MARRLWVPVVTGPLASYAAGFESWLRSRSYSPSAAADRLYQFDQLSRWLQREGLGVGELTADQAERFTAARHAAGLVCWASPQSVTLPLGYLRTLGVAPAPAPVVAQGPLEALLEARFVDDGSVDITAVAPGAGPTPMRAVPRDHQTQWRLEGRARLPGSSPSTKPTRTSATRPTVAIIDAATIGALVGGRNALRRQARGLTLRSPTPCASRVLDLCGLAGLVQPAPLLAGENESAPD